MECPPAQPPAAVPGRAHADEDGFTIVEILVASLVLATGMLGVLTLLTGALRATAANNERVGATNLARELVEATRGLDYDDMTTALVRARLQARDFGSGTPWTAQRRGVTYTITATSCAYDDPADKLATVPPAAVCMPRPAGTTGDANGEDFRRTTFQVAWREARGLQRSVKQTTLVVNPAGGLGPPIVSFTPVTQTITANISSVTVNWTTAPAQVLRWVVDDGASSGSSTGSTSFTTSWSIGSSGSGTEILDGSYQITAQPFDERDIAGEPKRANVVLNRRRPYPPPSFAGGHNTRLGGVDLQWSPNRERDILGYRVVRAGAGGDVQVCPAPAAGSMLAPAATSCADVTPPAGAATYHVVAIDRAPDNQQRDGDRSTLAVGVAGTRPLPPLGLLPALTVNGRPLLLWLAPLTGTPSFYRIYRDGTDVGYGDRHGRTSGSTPHIFTDDSSENVAHRYWVTAIDSSFNESDPVGPVNWTP